MKMVLASLLTISSAALTSHAQAPAAPPAPSPGVEELHRLDALPTFRRSAKVGSVSSYDRAGGNDDDGTMSSWYVWCAVGLYPNAGQDIYYVGSPAFTRAAIALGRHRTFTIEAPDASAANAYVQAAYLNGKPLDRAWLTHAELSRGGRLALHMGDRPSGWGSASRPPSLPAVKVFSR